jgi:RNA polymerase sigma-70 factor (ECF subfamily)
MNPEEMASRISRIETAWTLVREAHQPAEEGVARAQEALLTRYTGAIYRYLLGVLRDANAADEVFQEFALKFVRGAFRNADPERGRFRDFVKKALWNLIHDHRNKARKQPAALGSDSMVAAPAGDEKPKASSPITRS